MQAGRKLIFFLYEKELGKREEEGREKKKKKSNA